MFAKTQTGQYLPISISNLYLWKLNNKCVFGCQDGYKAGRGGYSVGRGGQ